MRTISTNFSRLALVLIAAFASVPAWAVNKCTKPDGQVVYQDAPCSNDKTAERVKTWDNGIQSGTSSRVNAWRFERRQDTMTGVVTCHATSPATWIASSPRKTTNVHVEVVLQKGTASLSIHGDTATEIFHVNVTGTGLKAKGYDFMPITRKVNATTVEFANPVQAAELVLRVFPNAEDFRLRLRFWPWDELRDTPEAISLAGFKQALALADQCSKQI